MFYLRLPPDVSGGFRLCLRRFFGGCPWCHLWQIFSGANFYAEVLRSFLPSGSGHPQNCKYLLGLYPRQPPGLQVSHLRSLRNFEDQDLEPRLIDYVIARN